MELDGIDLEQKKIKIKMAPTLQELASNHQINENSGMMIIQRGENKKGPFLFCEYDQGYPRPLYRGRVNLMGGAQEFKTVKDGEGKKLKVGFLDYNPWDTMRREIWEEVKNPKNEKGFASHALIKDLRNQMQHTLRPIAEYFSVVRVPPRADGSGVFDYVSIDTTWLSNLPFELFDEVTNAMKKGRRIINEGNLTQVTVEELVSGQRLCAWDSGIMMADYLQAPIPNPNRVIATKFPTANIARQNYYHYREDSLLNYIPLDSMPAMN